MAYESIYRSEFTNAEGQNVIVHLSDTTSGQINPPTYHDMKGVDIQRITISDNRKKEGIKGVRVEFSFLHSSVFNINTFSAGEDNRWLMEVYLVNTSNPMFKGYLINDSLREMFLPDGTHTVNMTASDNLGILKEIPLTNFTGEVPRGKYRIIDFIVWCFSKTNLSLDVNCIYNLMPQELDGATQHTFDEVFIDSKTFETEINEREDCYTVLEKLTKGCVITQDYGFWWICRTDEMEGVAYRYYNYTTTGVFTGATTVLKAKTIGRLFPIKLTNKDATVSTQRQVKFVSQTFRFKYPLEIIDNIDFSRGLTFIGIINPSIEYFFIRSYANLGAFPAAGETELTYKATDTGFFYKWTGTAYVLITGAEAPSAAAYEFDDWNEKQGNPDAPGTFDSTAYVTKVTQFGDERARYLVLTNPATPSATRSYVESNPVPVGRADKFTCSVDYRFPTNITGGGAASFVFLAVRLKGEDGTNWWLGREIIAGEIQPEKWYLSNSTWSNFSFNPGPFQEVSLNGSYDTREWQSVSWDAPPVPVGGEIFLLLNAMNHHGNTAYAFDNTDVHYANLQFHYIPFINGTYQKFNGQRHKITDPGEFRANIEEDVDVSDGPKKIFKGIPFLETGGQYHLTNGWYNYLYGTSNQLEIAPFGKYQAFELWNQNNRIIRTFEASLMGINSDTPSDIPGLLHHYYFDAISDHTDTKIYQLLSYSQNLRTCTWSGVFMDIFDNNDAKDFDSDHEFKMITGNE